MNDDILKMHKLDQKGGACPVMVAHIPKPIMKEIDVWVKESKKIKNHPLAELKAHENAGYKMADGKKHNTYQCSISPRLIEESFWLSWVLRLAAKHWGAGKMHRQFKIRKWDGHFDGYDIWTNFAYKGDDNLTHNHGGFLSGVIYYKNHGHPTIFDEFDIGYKGFDGTMVLFPSQCLHHVEPQIENKERITLAFNLVTYDYEDHKEKLGW